MTGQTTGVERNLSVHEVVRTVLTDLIGFYGSADLDDDAVAVCLDWHGRPSPTR